MKKLTLPSLRNLAPQPKKKVRKLAANAAHRLTPPAFEDYDEEPSTKLSTAFFVVLVLHLVAVGGIYAFHTIKSRRGNSEPQSAAVASQTATAPSAPAAKPSAPPAPPAGNALPPQATQSAATAVTASKIASVPAPAPSPATATKLGAVSSGNVGVPAAATQKPAGATKPEPSGPSAVIVQPKATPAAPAGAEPVASGKTYTVAKGDNPVTIAKRLGVSQEELLKVNGIEDPRKLQIGQVLKVPAKKAAN
jgi:LysM repeat protein